MQKLIIAGLLILLFAGCKSVDSSKIVGKWQWDYKRWSEYFADGTVELQGGIRGEWTFDGARITIQSDQLSQKKLEMDVAYISDSRIVVERVGDHKRFVGLKYEFDSLTSREKNMVGEWESPENAFLRFGRNRQYFDLEDWAAIWTIENDTLLLFGDRAPRKLSYRIKEISPDSMLMQALFNDQEFMLTRKPEEKEEK